MANSLTGSIFNRRSVNQSQALNKDLNRSELRSPWSDQGE